VPGLDGRLPVEQDVALACDVDVLGGAVEAIGLAALADDLALVVDDAREDREMGLVGRLAIVDEVGFPAIIRWSRNRRSTMRDPSSG
jgi:hypothetical protein